MNLFILSFIFLGVGFSLGLIFNDHFQKDDEEDALSTGATENDSNEPEEKL